MILFYCSTTSVMIKKSILIWLKAFMFQTGSVAPCPPRRVWLHFVHILPLGSWSPLGLLFLKLDKSCTFSFSFYVMCFSPLIILVIPTGLPAVYQVFWYQIAKTSTWCFSNGLRSGKQREVIPFLNLLAVLFRSASWCSWKPISSACWGVSEQWL